MENLIDQPTDASFMGEALRLARKALEKEEVRHPINRRAQTALAITRVNDSRRDFTSEALFRGFLHRRQTQLLPDQNSALHAETRFMRTLSHGFETEDQGRDHFASFRRSDRHRDHLVELITPLAFYAGWPPASNAVGIARQVFAEAAP